MAVYCALTPIPLRSDLSAIFAGKNINLPALPTFPKPFFGSINDPEHSIEHWINEACNNAKAAMLAFILDLLPKLPSFPVPPYNIDFSVDLKFDAEKLKKQIIEYIKGIFPEWPLHGSFFPINIPDIDIWHVVSNFLIDAYKMVIDKIMELVQPFVDIAKLILENAQIPFINIKTWTLPTLPALKELLKLPGLDIDFSQFGVDIKIPKPPYFDKKFNVPDMNVAKWATGLLGDFVGLIIKRVFDFIKYIFDIIGGLIPSSFPHLCIDDVTGLFIHMGPWTLAAPDAIGNGAFIAPPGDADGKVRPWTAGNAWAIGDVYSVKAGEAYNYYRVHTAYTPRKFRIFPSNDPTNLSDHNPAPWDYTDDAIGIIPFEFDGDAQFVTQLGRATGTLILDGDKIIGMDILDGGSGYLLPPKVQLTGPQGSVKATAVIEDGKVVNVIITT